MDEQVKSLHIVMFPWLAIGHLRPFFRLAKCLARKGHRISFISTPRNLQRAVKVPPDLSHLINLITIPLPDVKNLPRDAESSMDVPHVKQQLLKVAVDLLEPQIRRFLQEARPKPDWIVYDYATHWLPQLAQETGISRAFFSLFTAAVMAFMGPPSALLNQNQTRSTAEDYTVVPEWIPFPSNMALRPHEMIRNFEKDAEGNEYDSGTSDTIRFGLSLDGSDIVIFRSCVEFEPEWFDLIRKLYQKTVIPIGILPLADEDDESETNAEWLKVEDWLGLQKEGSSVYVALGTEVTLSQKEAHELALGLEQCGLPFLWVLNRDNLLDLLPDGFCQRVKDKGIVYANWAPQIKILSHPSIGGFLTHCGWNSVTEALSYGRVLILFPVMNDQGMNARLLLEKKLGVEIPRNVQDGSFTSNQVAETLKFAVLSEEGGAVRENARNMQQLFRDKGRNESYMDSLVQAMEKV